MFRIQDIDEFGEQPRRPEQSAEAVGKLLDNDVEFMARISPVRNTDFNHLKDGLIKSILAHPKSKELKEDLAPGLEQLRKAFTRKGSVPKNHLLCWNV
ncbi:Altered inheritance of mitochondria protein 18, mitochondrial [Candida viswanathii]|uniref:Altered inheritance of mitochondria protein 18, mitochondrial n=1 Tax=Candida viswanathii TaxID=5486 RepID=A0A367YF22_9ASCO|nr:Altered inheritance of mitochondria protein 18, mitochondrial [Candida viswanathii]